MDAVVMIYRPRLSNVTENWRTWLITDEVSVKSNGVDFDIVLHYRGWEAYEVLTFDVKLPD